MKRSTLFLSVIFVVFSAQEMQADDRVAKLEMRIAELELRVAKLERLLSRTESERATQIKPRNYRNKANWRRLKLGMTKTQVKAILGDPPYRRVIPFLGDYWYYPDASGGHVQFDTSGLIVGWDEP